MSCYQRKELIIQEHQTNKISKGGLFYYLHVIEILGAAEQNMSTRIDYIHY